MGAGQCGAEPETCMFFLKSVGKVSKHFETRCPVVKKHICCGGPKTYILLKNAGKVSKHFETKCPVAKNIHMLWQAEESYFTCLQDHLYVRDPVFQKLP